jgi:hypothetical protein
VAFSRPDRGFKAWGKGQRRLEVYDVPDVLPNYQENKRNVGSILPELAVCHIFHESRYWNGLRNRRRQMFMDEGIWNRTCKARNPKQGRLLHILICKCF